MDRHDRKEQLSCRILIPSVAGFGMTRIDRFPCRIGRWPDCDITIPDSTVSGRHATLLINADGKLMVRDEDSTNGTYLRGEPVQSVVIERPVDLSFGEAMVRFIPMMTSASSPLEAPKPSSSSPEPVVSPVGRLKPDSPPPQVDLTKVPGRDVAATQPRLRVIPEHEDDPVASQNAFMESVQANMQSAGDIVVIADDEMAFRALIKRSIRKFSPSLQIVEALNGKEVLVKLAEIREKHKRDPLFIVTDLSMPLMDGWELVETLKKDYLSRGLHQGIPIIVYSSTDGERRAFFGRKTIHHRPGAGYSPLIKVAKEACIDATRYDAKGEEGLMTWLRYFVQHG
jgi:CheY-like chemotaxis protein/pSer/pThr/pTyr-binding forkhead associated (FHA) protein